MGNGANFMSNDEHRVVTSAIDTTAHPIQDAAYAARCRDRLDATGALILTGFFADEAIDAICRESEGREDEAYYTATSHNVYLTAADDTLGSDHTFNRQVESSKGLLADDQIPSDSVLRSIYGDESFRSFLCDVLGIDAIHPYADPLSSINVHFASEGQELGWHFDNSSFAVTMLLRASQAGGVFQYVPAVRDSSDPDRSTVEEFTQVEAVLDGQVIVNDLQFAPGDLVLFRGRDAMHRVTPTEGSITRMLVVLAFNDQPGVALSSSALETFYGRGGD